MALAFGFGIMAAAPVGPVNMVAIRRGLVAHWPHALYVALGSMAVESMFIAAVFWGGNEILSVIRDYEGYVATPASLIIMCVGLLITRKAIKNPQRVLGNGQPNGQIGGPANGQPEVAQRIRTRSTIARDILTGALLTVINPATFLYWTVAAGPSWLGRANPENSFEVLLGLAAATGGLAVWFGFITALVRFRPQNVGPRFFRIVNAICGVVLVIMGLVLAIHQIKGK